MKIDFKIYKGNFASRVRLEDFENTKKVISVTEENTVFNKLESVWQVKELEKASPNFLNFREVVTSNTK